MDSVKRKKSRYYFSTTIENTSILRKFTILFVLMSLIPMVVLFYLYTEMRLHGSVQVPLLNFNVALIFIVCGILLGYATMRQILQQLIDLNTKNTEILKDILEPEKIERISGERNEISALSESFKLMTGRLEENVRSLELAKRTLSNVMSRIGRGISNTQNIDTFFELILETVSGAVSGEKATIFVYDRQEKELYIKMAYGADFKAAQNVRIKVKEGGPLYEFLRKKEAIILHKNFSELTHRALRPLFDFPIMAAPLVVKDKARGIITVSREPSKGGFNVDDVNLFYNIASQTAVAIENSLLSRDMESTYFETISALALAVDAKDKYSRGHLDRVAGYCVQIGRKLGLDEEDIQTLRDGARIHDLGKIGIPDEVLSKEGKLTDQEWVLMRRHPEIGESIIKPIRSLTHLCDMVRHHHEKLDGSGYPDGLKGDKITPLVRILTIADIYDALTTDRPYRDRLSQDQACAELRKMHTQLDQDIVELFIESLYANED